MIPLRRCSMLSLAVAANSILFYSGVLLFYEIVIVFIHYSFHQSLNIMSCRIRLLLLQLDIDEAGCYSLWLNTLSDIFRHSDIRCPPSHDKFLSM